MRNTHFFFVSYLPNSVPSVKQYPDLGKNKLIFICCTPSSFLNRTFQKAKLLTDPPSLRRSISKRQNFKRKQLKTQSLTRWREFVHDQHVIAVVPDGLVVDPYQPRQCVYVATKRMHAGATRRIDMLNRLRIPVSPNR